MLLQVNVLWCLFFISSFSNCVHSSKLNVPRVLLPLFNDFSTNFTLDVSDDGCYKWSTSRLDVIQLIPLDTELGCSRSALISTISKEASRNTVIVFAEEISTGQVFRCDVIVNVISYLNIVARTKELFMEEAPEQFEARAYDDQGNEFTTLEGVEFHWTISNWNEQIKTGLGNSVLRFITFRDSPYETPRTIARFDALGLRGHIVLLEGIKTGSAKVSVQLPHKEYKHVAPIEVQLNVVANLIIDPPDAYILQGDTLRYRIAQVQAGKLEEITLPSQQYYLEVEDSGVATLERSSHAVVVAAATGRTRVVLRDRNADADDEAAPRLPSASLTVAASAYLVLNLLPHRNWHVQVDQRCTIAVDIFDSDNHRMHIGEGVKVITSWPDDMLEVREMTKNGTHICGIARQPGTATIVSRLESVRSKDGSVFHFKPYISTQAELVIFPRLALRPAEVVLPWDPHKILKPEAKLRASGGDGTYIWNSVNQSVAIVTQTGVVKAVNQGETDVFVAMSRNHHNRESSRVYVLPPSHIEIVEYMLEAEVDSPIFIHVAMHAERFVFGKKMRVPFTNCQDLPFQVKLWEDNFFYNASAKSEPVGIACATLAVVGTSVGSTKLSVVYEQGSTHLEANAVVAAYQPLQVIHPSSGESVLAVGSSRHIVWSGGPKPWMGRNFEHRHSISSDQSIVETVELSVGHQGTYVFSVLCRALGEADVTLTVTNHPTLAGCKSVQSSSVVKVFCSRPRYLSLAIQPLSSSCPANMNSDRAVAPTYHDIKLLMTFKDDQGRNFDNATSIQVDWNLSKKNLVSIPNSKGIMLEHKTENGYILPLDHYQMLVPKNRTGLLRVTATAVGYNERMIYELGITPEEPPFGILNEAGYFVTPNIQASLVIALVNDTIITPNRTAIFNHPTNKVSLAVSEGSGHYSIVLSSPDIATVTYVEGSNALEIIPKVDGLLRIALFDLCLPSKPAVVELQVLRVGSIKVDVVDRIEKGRCVTAIVHLYDSLDHPLSIIDTELLELRPFIESDIITIKPIGESQDRKEVLYSITGLHLGETKLTFSSGHGAREVQSAPVSIQVFPPLRLLPRNVTITIGAAFQLSYVGGPQPDSTLEFSSTESTIAKVSNIGLIEGNKFGDISVYGMAVGLNKMTGSQIIYSRDSVDVHVIPLEGIKIQTPLTKLKVGSRMPVWVVGIPDQLTPLVLGSITPPLLFKWHVSSPDIVELRDIFFSTGIELMDKDKVSMRVKALKPGRATLHLNVTVQGSITKCPEKATVVFSNSIELEVFEELTLVKPNISPSLYKPILLAHETDMQLQTNKDGVNKILYSVLHFPNAISGSGGTVSSSTALSKKGPVLTVDNNGLVSTSSTSGKALVLIQSLEGYGVEQFIGVNAEVKPIHYLMININAKLHVDPEQQISALPRGLDLELVISYHDNTGAEFTAARTDIKMRPSRFDKMHLKRGLVNGTLSASLVGSGNTVLKVWDDTIPHHSKDYVKFPVEHLMYPDKNVLTVGDIVCFSMPLLSESGESGKWSCADPDILAIESDDGIGRATGKTGTAHVTYHLSNAITATTPMQVLPISSIAFLQLEGRNVSNTEGHTFLASLVLLNGQSPDKQKNILANDGNPCRQKDFTVSHYPFTCEARFNSIMTSIDINEIFIIRPHFSMKTGMYSCAFKTAGYPSMNISTLQSNITLRAVSGKAVSDPLVIPFLPAIFVHTTEIQLSDKQPSGYFKISGIELVLAQIEVVAKETNFLTIGSRERSSPDSVIYVLKVKPNLWGAMSSNEQQLHVSVVSPITSQQISIAVVVRIKGDNWLHAPCLAANTDIFSSDFTWSPSFLRMLTIGISVVVLIVILFLSYNLIMNSRVETSQNIYCGSTPRAMSPRILNCATSPASTERSSSPRQVFSDTEPIYGDPSLSCLSPDLKLRTRRLVT
ncbi:nuclear pore membrane glycoprotein 210 [Nilaparvata lugens]|uniref:nuclear pore membrane glycoprotein 210 n=1 Tax=Nilaparvata lugens TaxID=108931 RepID=UPI00193CB05F|nr:nuclear pore membrane glycoprotein 210 [Nilaparvata lugens]